MLFVGVAFELLPAIALETARFDSSIATFSVYTMARQWGPSIWAGHRNKSKNGSGRWQGKIWLRAKER